MNEILKNIQDDFAPFDIGKKYITCKQSTHFVNPNIIECWVSCGYEFDNVDFEKLNQIAVQHIKTPITLFWHDRFYSNHKQLEKLICIAY